MLAFDADVKRAAASPPSLPDNEGLGRTLLVEAAILADINREDEEDSDPELEVWESGGEYTGPMSAAGDHEDYDSDGADGENVDHVGPSGTATKKAQKISEGNRAQEHLKRVEASFEGFRCGCAAAAQKGMSSCLDSFSKIQLRMIHHETYGPPGARISTAVVSERIHVLYAGLATPVAAPDARGHQFKILQLKVLGMPVCAKAFEAAVGGSRGAHRQRKSFTLRGVTPSTVEAQKMAKLVLKAEEFREDHRLARAAYARNWWAEELRLHDWLPNENAIRFKGPFWHVMHRQYYKPVADAQSGLRALSYKPFKLQMLPGARQLAASFPDCVDPELIRVKRSARHSNFPECTRCQQGRAGYLQVMGTPGASPEAIQEAYDYMQEHMSEWQGDRKQALQLKDHSSGMGRDTIYECDDKCGSQWCTLPVAENGRDNKSNCKAKFKFGIQCNIVAGAGGVNRFTVVPKHIRTGGNFGLTCLILALASAARHGRLAGQAGSTLYRHTDGGPDNLNKATHLFHWMLVWLGIFNEVVWFRFDAGHSHTELADRFFSMLKRLFTTVNGKERARRVDSFVELEASIQETFAKSPEVVEFEYIFANWDFNTWFKDCGLDPHAVDLQGISFDNVFRYTYDESCWAHGCVKVTFKDRLSRRATAREAEYAPIRTIKTEDGERNVTTDDGVRFVLSPPDLLRTEPPREPFDEALQPASVIRGLVSKRDGNPEELNTEAKAHWAALAAIYGESSRPGGLPDMPVEQDGHKFHGSPQRLLPILKRLRRFPRPFLYWCPFTERPPAEWPDKLKVRAASSSPGTKWLDGDVSHVDGLRDPRVVNRVTGAHYPEAQAKQHAKELLQEEWVREFSSKVPVEHIRSKKLYLIQLECAEGGLRLGFAEAGNPAEDEQHEALWYVKVGSTGDWGQGPTFVPYKVNSRRQVDLIPRQAFLMEVQDDWLTEGTRDTKHATLRLTETFTRTLKLLARKNPREYGAETSGKAEASPMVTQDTAGQAPPLGDSLGGGRGKGGNGKRSRDKGGSSTIELEGSGNDMEAEDDKTKRSREKTGTTPTEVGKSRSESSCTEENASGTGNKATDKSVAKLGPANPTPSYVYQPSDCMRKLADHLGAQVRFWASGTSLRDADVLSSMVELIDDGMHKYYDRSTIRQKKGQLTESNVHHIVLTHTGGARTAVVAFISFQLHAHGGLPHIDELHVRGGEDASCANAVRNCRRQGVGTILMQEAERVITATGMGPKIRLTVHTENADAIEFYIKIGFGFESHCLNAGVQLWCKPKPPTRTDLDSSRIA
jgi:ribosomal protein S18 acetylase RimI-like enzyme